MTNSAACCKLDSLRRRAGLARTNLRVRRIENRWTYGGLWCGEVAAYFILAVLLDVVIGLTAQPSVLHGYLSDPDTLMRLVRLRDILVQHVPLHVVARDGSGDGTVLHLSLIHISEPTRPY